MTYLLIDSEYIRGDIGQRLVFLDTRTGNIIKSEDKKSIYPYVYTTLTPEELFLMEGMVENKFVKDCGDGTFEFNNKKIHQVTSEVKIDPFTQRPIELTKIELKNSFMFNTYDQKWKKGKQYMGLFDVLPEKYLFNSKQKYADTYLSKAGWIMGMAYDFGENGMVAQTPDEYTWHESFDSYDEKLVNWMLPRLFSDIPSFSQHIVAIDIEVDSPVNRMPDAFEAPYPISSISFVSKGEKKGYVLADHVRKTVGEDYEKYDWKGIDYKIYENESVMLKDALEYLVNHKCPIVSGFNIDLFDLPYLVSRANLYGVTPSKVYARRGTVVGVDGNPYQTVIKGIKNKIIIDLYSFMSNPSIKNYAFKAVYERNSLEQVSQALLGKGKYQHDKWYSEMSSAELLYYNILDSELIIELFEYKDEVILKLMMIMMRLGNLTLPSIARRKISASIKGLFDQSLDIFNYYAPNHHQLKKVGTVETMNEDGKFKGALVIDPIQNKSQGVHYGVTCVDYNSLYPSIIKVKNVCFSTINCFHSECKKNTVPEVTHHICGKKTGLIPQLLGFIRDTRVYFIKPQMKDNPQYAIIEQALKVFINAGYGVFSSPTFDYYCPPFGEIVTAWGRNSITSIFDKVDADGIEKVYSDTDSVFIIADEEYINHLIEWALENLGLELGIDYIAEIMVLYKSKNYIMRIDGKFNVKGMTGQKKNAVPIVRECFENSLEVIKKLERDNLSFIKEKITEVVKTYIQTIRHTDDLDVNQFIVSTSMNRPMNSYKVEGTHVRCARILASQLEKKMGRSADHTKLVPAGSTIEYVHVYDEPFKRFYKENKSVSTPALPIMVTTNDMVNRTKYVDVLVKTLNQLLVPFGITHDDVLNQNASLDEWF